MKLQVKEQLTFKEMLRRSPCSIAVLIAFIVSDSLIAKGLISVDERLYLPWIVVIIAAICVMIVAYKNKYKQIV